MYKVSYKPAARTVRNSLPAEARAEFERAVEEFRQNPWAATDHHPASEHEEQRILVLQHTTIVMVIIDGPERVRRVRILDVEHFP